MKPRDLREEGSSLRADVPGAVELPSSRERKGGRVKLMLEMKAEDLEMMSRSPV